MPLVVEKSAEVVEIPSSDDEGDNPPRQVQNNATTGSGNRTLENRSFWKAGSFDIGPTKWTPSQGELEHARVHPKFLHSNATSHKWAFGAIAELLDNAVDEINNGATYVKVDRIFSKRDNSPALLFLDDGGGMDPDGIRKCMSLGYSTKKTNNTIGQYGNGFKTSTMRLGADVIVFSRASRNSRATQSVGLLSYTFLRRTGQDDVIVPMVDFDVSNHWAEPIVYSSQADWSANLKTILEWSPFASKEALMQQFGDIGPHGTKIIIFNLWLNDEGIYELNFDEDDEDIRLRDEANSGTKLSKRAAELQSHISYRILHSLRAYASMLYLRKFKNFRIFLRGKPVEQFNIADELKHRQLVTYRPQISTTKEVVVEATLGFIKEAPDLGVTGYNVYHKNRLIRPFWKVTADGNSKGHGVVGVLEANFIEPAHDKQDFERSSLFSRLEVKLKQLLMDYWKSHCHLIGHQPDPSFLRKMQSDSTMPLHAPREMHDQAIVGLAANLTPVSGGAQTAQLANHVRTVYSNEMHAVQAPPGFEAYTQLHEQNSSVQYKEASTSTFCVQQQPSLRFSHHRAEMDFNQETTCRDSSRAIDQICDENIQLFLRCEEHMQRENDLKNTVEDLEKQVTETKRKCAELSSRLELLRKQKLVK